jgi:hypothetical protein
MPVHVALRALNRSTKVRVKRQGDGVLVNLSPTKDTIVDVTDPVNRRQLAKHGAIGTYIETGFAGTNVDTTGDGSANNAVPANS